MKKWFTLILASLVFLFLPPHAFNNEINTSAGYRPDRPGNSQSSCLPSKLNKIVLGYYTEDYAGDILSYNSMDENHTSIDGIAVFSYLIDEGGSLIGQPYSQAVDLAENKDIKSLMLVHNYVKGFSPELAHRVLSADENRCNLENNILSLIKEHGFDGVNIDLEGIPLEDRENFSIFLEELKVAFSPYGYLLTVSIPARTADDIPNNWSGAYDYQRIGEIADLITVMAYDEHWYGGEPGPVASLPWVEQVLNYSLSQITREKILLGIPAYGYDWSSDGECKNVNWDEISVITSGTGETVWDYGFSSPYYIYSDQQGDRHEVWFENQSSLELKLDLVNKNQIAGVAIWRLGFEDSAFWQSLVAKFG